MKTNGPLLLVIGLIAAIVCVATFKLWPMLVPPSSETLPAQTCNPANQRCSAFLPGYGQLDFKISPAPIRPLQPLQLEIWLTGPDPDRMEVDFDGTQMKMGLNRSILARSGDRYTGQTILPVCVNGGMEWSATVMVTKGSRTIAVPFSFEVPAR